MITYDKLQETHKEISVKKQGAILLGHEASTDKIVVLNVDIDGNLKVNTNENVTIETKRWYANNLITANNTTEVFAKIAESNKKYLIEKVLFCGNGNGYLQLNINGSPVLSLYNSYFSPSVAFNCNIYLNSTQELKVSITNTTIESNNNDYETFIFYKEYDI